MWPEVCLLKWGRGAECTRNSQTLWFPATKIISKWPVILKHFWKMTRKNSSTVSDSFLEQISTRYWKKIVVLKETERIASKLLGGSDQLRCMFQTPCILYQWLTALTSSSMESLLVLRNNVSDLHSCSLYEELLKHARTVLPSNQLDYIRPLSWIEANAKRLQATKLNPIASFRNVSRFLGWTPGSNKP